MIRVNLLPGGQRKRTVPRPRPEPGKLFSGFSDFRPLKALTGHMDRFVLAAAAGVVVMVASVGVMFLAQASRAQGLGERERRAVQDSARFAAVLRERAQAEARRDAIQRQLTVIQSLDDRRYLWPHLLEEISGALPPFTWLTSVVQTSAPPNPALADSATTALRQKEDTTKPAGRARVQKASRESAMAAAGAPTRFRIVGNTVDIQALTRFMKDLESSPFIQNVQLARSDLVVVDQKEVTQFQLDAQTERPDSSVVTLMPFDLEVR